MSFSGHQIPFSQPLNLCRTPNMTRIIVHAGFHKTGTSSLQDYIRQNRAALAPYVTAYVKEDFLAAGNRGRIYGLKPYPWRLRQFRRDFRAFAEKIDSAPVIFLTWEGFSGVMPGHRRLFGRRIQNYRRAAIPLARCIRSELRRQFGNRAEIEFLYTTRETDSWIRSVWGHLVRSIRLTEDADTFREGFQRLPDLPEEATAMARALKPSVVHNAKLEDIGATPQGPITALFDLLNLTAEQRADLPEGRRRNMGMSCEAEAEFLRLNRKEPDDFKLKYLKDQIAKTEWQKQG